MKVALHGLQKNHYIYEAFAANLGHENVTTFIPPIIRKGYGDLADTYDSNTFLEAHDEFDLIAFGITSFYDQNLMKILNKNGSTIKIFIDQNDDFLLRSIYKHENISHYFKRELFTKLPPLYTLKWYARHIYGSQILPPIHRKIGFPVHKILSFPYKIATTKEVGTKLHPFPLSIQPDGRFIGNGSRIHDIDIFYCVNLKTIRERHVYFNYLSNLLKREKGRINGIVKDGNMSKEDYLHALTRSKASVSVRGMGFDTDRYWETACYGAALFTPPPPILIENDFIDGESAVHFSSAEDLKKKIEKYVVKTAEWEEIARRGKELFFKFHTPEKRIKNGILDVIKEP